MEYMPGSSQTLATVRQCREDGSGGTQFSRGGRSSEVLSGDYFQGESNLAITQMHVPARDAP
jgi:hypothetical protein